MNTNEYESEARKRYKKRGLHIEPKNPRQIFQNELSHKLIPSLDDYLFALLAGLCAGAALMLNASPLWILTAALIPFAGPFIGLALSCGAGSLRFFLKSLGKYLLMQLLYLAGSAGAVWFAQTKGFAANGAAADFFSSYDLYTVITVIISAVFTVVLLKRSTSMAIGAFSSALMLFIMAPLTVAVWGYFSGNRHYILPSLEAALVYSIIALTAAVILFILMRAASFNFGSVVMCLIVIALGAGIAAEGFGLSVQHGRHFQFELVQRFWITNNHAFGNRVSDFCLKIFHFLHRHLVSHRSELHVGIFNCFFTFSHDVVAHISQDAETMLACAIAQIG